MAKQYQDASVYEQKLAKVMARLAVDKFDYNWDRHSCWIEFFYESQFYRFEHSVDNAQKNGLSIKYGSDAFAQLVLTLEDIARMTERGIYKLSTWIAGLKALPSSKAVPECLKILGFNNIPTMSELKVRYRTIAKTAHPDTGGNAEYFISVEKAYSEAKSIIECEVQGE